MLPPLASIDQFRVRLPSGMVDDWDRAAAALEDASALVRVEAGKTWVNELGVLEGVPDVAVTVTIAAARRAFVNPDHLTAESIADYSATFAPGSSDIYLTKAERNAVRRVAGRAGLWTLATTRADADADTPSVLPEPWRTSTAEEVDPFGEGWTG
jgi:hypothetical protein